MKQLWYVVIKNWAGSSQIDNEDTRHLFGRLSVLLLSTDPKYPEAHINGDNWTGAFLGHF